MPENVTAPPQVTEPLPTAPLKGPLSKIITVRSAHQVLVFVDEMLDPLFSVPMGCAHCPEWVSVPKSCLLPLTLLQGQRQLAFKGV